MKWRSNGALLWCPVVPTRRNNSARELSVFAESAMAVKRVVMQHFSMNLALEARLRSLDEDSGLGHEPEVVEMETDPDSAGILASSEADEGADLDEAIHFGHLSLESERSRSAVDSGRVNNNNGKKDGEEEVDVVAVATGGGGGRKKVTFGLAPPSQSGLAQRRLKSCLSLDASSTSGSNSSNASQ